MTAVTADAQERFDRLESLKREVRKAHRKLSADQVTALATLHELIIAEMVASRKPAGDRLLMVSREIAVQTPLPTPDPIKVMVEFAEGIVGMTTCPHCHQAFEVPDYVAPVRERKPADEVIDLEAQRSTRTRNAYQRPPLRTASLLSRSYTVPVTIARMRKRHRFTTTDRVVS